MVSILDDDDDDMAMLLLFKEPEGLDTTLEERVLK